MNLIQITKYYSSIDKWGVRAQNLKMEEPNFLIY